MGPALACRDSPFDSYLIWSEAPAARSVRVINADRSDISSCVKSLTSGLDIRNLDSRNKFVAEREGFEPPVRREQNLHIRPRPAPLILSAFRASSVCLGGPCYGIVW